MLSILPPMMLCHPHTPHPYCHRLQTRSTPVPLLTAGMSRRCSHPQAALCRLPPVAAGSKGPDPAPGEPSPQAAAPAVPAPDDVAASASDAVAGTCDSSSLQLPSARAGSGFGRIPLLLSSSTGGNSNSGTSMDSTSSGSSSGRGGSGISSWRQQQQQLATGSGGGDGGDSGSGSGSGSSSGGGSPEQQRPTQSAHEAVRTVVFAYFKTVAPLLLMSVLLTVLPVSWPGITMAGAAMLASSLREGWRQLAAAWQQAVVVLQAIVVTFFRSAGFSSIPLTDPILELLDTKYAQVS